MAYFLDQSGFQVPISFLDQSNQSLTDSYYPIIGALSHNHHEVLPDAGFHDITCDSKGQGSLPVGRLDTIEQVPGQTAENRRNRGGSAHSPAQQKRGKKQKSNGDRNGKANEEISKPKADEKVLKEEISTVKDHDSPPPRDYVHVRARRGQATDSHSLAERARRERISERMRTLQDLVPGCEKVSGKAQMLDQIIAYVQSLQTQVQYLSMKVASLSPVNCDYEMEQDPMIESAISGHQCSPAQLTMAAMASSSTDNDYDHQLRSSYLIKQVQRLFSQSQYACDVVLPWGVDDQKLIHFDSSQLGNALFSLY